MLKRNGVGGVIHITNIQEYDGIKFGDVATVTCVNIQRRKIVNEIGFWVTDESVFWDFTLNKKMREKGFELKKCENIRVVHIDIFPELKINLQVKKYPFYTKNRQDGKGKINYNLTNYND